MNTMPLFARTFARTVAAASLCTLLGGHGAFAQTQKAPPQTATADADALQDAQEPRVGKGDATRAWLGAQASRKGASKTRQSLSGPVMSTVHERYVKSFSHEVEPTPFRADMAPTSR